MRVLDDLGDAEVEQLDRELGSRGPEDEGVRGFDVTMRNPLPVSERERFGGGLEKSERGLRRPRWQTGRAFLLEQLVESVIRREPR